MNLQSATRISARAFGRALPHLSREELLWRFHAILGTVVFQLIGATAMERVAEGSPFGVPSGNDEDMRARTLTFLAAGLKAPATKPHKRS